MIYISTIALYSNKINQMPSLIKDVKQAVTDYRSELTALKTKTLAINKSVYNLDDVISSILSSSQTQEQKISSLKTLQTVMNWTSAISNGFYSIGSIYNLVKGISNASLKQYSESYLKNTRFRDAIKNADKFVADFGPNKSTFWVGLGKNGESVSNAFATNNGGELFWKCYCAYWI